MTQSQPGSARWLGFVLLTAAVSLVCHASAQDPNYCAPPECMDGGAAAAVYSSASDVPGMYTSSGAATSVPGHDETEYSMSHLEPGDNAHPADPRENPVSNTIKAPPGLAVPTAAQEAAKVYTSSALNNAYLDNPNKDPAAMQWGPHHDGHKGHPVGPAAERGVEQRNYASASAYASASNANGAEFKFARTKTYKNSSDIPGVPDAHSGVIPEDNAYGNDHNEPLEGCKQGETPNTPDGCQHNGAEQVDYGKTPPSPTPNSDTPNALNKYEERKRRANASKDKMFWENLRKGDEKGKFTSTPKIPSNKLDRTMVPPGEATQSWVAPTMAPTAQGYQSAWSPAYARMHKTGAKRNDPQQKRLDDQRAANHLGVHRERNLRESAEPTTLDEQRKHDVETNPSAGGLPTAQYPGEYTTMDNAQGKMQDQEMTRAANSEAPPSGVKEVVSTEVGPVFEGKGKRAPTPTQAPRASSLDTVVSLHDLLQMNEKKAKASVRSRMAKRMAVKKESVTTTMATHMERNHKKAIQSLLPVSYQSTAPQAAANDALTADNIGQYSESIAARQSARDNVQAAYASQTSMLDSDIQMAYPVHVQDRAPGSFGEEHPMASSDRVVPGASEHGPEEDHNKEEETTAQRELRKAKEVAAVAQNAVDMLRAGGEKAALKSFDPLDGNDGPKAAAIALSANVTETPAKLSKNDKAAASVKREAMKDPVIKAALMGTGDETINNDQYQRLYTGLDSTATQYDRNKGEPTAGMHSLDETSLIQEMNDNDAKTGKRWPSGPSDADDSVHMLDHA